MIYKYICRAREGEPRPKHLEENFYLKAIKEENRIQNVFLILKAFKIRVSNRNNLERVNWCENSRQKYKEHGMTLIGSSGQ